MPKKRKAEAAGGDDGGDDKKAKPAAATAGGVSASASGGGLGPGGLGPTLATAGINGCATLPGNVLMPWVGLGTYKARSRRQHRPR